MDNEQKLLNQDEWLQRAVLDRSLRLAAKKLEPWFEIDKIKPYAVYVWTKGEGSENVFDIYRGYLQFYQCTKPWEMPNEVWPIIKEIQELLED